MRIQDVIQRLRPLKETAIWSAITAMIGYLSYATESQIAAFIALGLLGLTVLVGAEALPRALAVEADHAGDDGEITPDQGMDRLVFEGDFIRLIGPHRQGAVRISRLALIAHWAGPPPVLELRQADGYALHLELKTTLGLLQLEEALCRLDGYPRGRVHAALRDASEEDDIIWESDDG